MENAAVSNTDWKAIGITAAIVAVVGFGVALGALYAHEGIKKMAEKKSSQKEKDSTKKA